MLSPQGEYIKYGVSLIVGDPRGLRKKSQYIFFQTLPVGCLYQKNFNSEKKGTPSICLIKSRLKDFQ